MPTPTAGKTQLAGAQGQVANGCACQGRVGKPASSAAPIPGLALLPGGGGGGRLTCGRRP